MINEKDSIKTILEGRGVISNGVFDELRFKKLVTEPWIYTKTIKYGFDKMNGNDTQVIDNEPVIEKVVETKEPITVVEEPAVEAVKDVEELEVVAETVVEAIEDAVVEAIEEHVVETVEEPVVENTEVPTEEHAEVDENPIEQEVNLTELPGEEVKVEEPATEEVVETSKKKTSKKK